MIYSTINIILYYINFNYEPRTILILIDLILIVKLAKKIIDILSKIYKELKIDL